MRVGGELFDARGKTTVRESRSTQDGHCQNTPDDSLGDEIIRQCQVFSAFGTARRDRENARRMERAVSKTKLLYGVEEERKRVAEASEEPVVVPVVVVAVHVHPAVIVPAVERRVAVCKMPSAPPSLECSQDCILFGIVMPWHSAPSILLLEGSTCATLSRTVIRDTLDAWILVSVARNRDRLHTHLLPKSFYIRF